jgi:Bacterial type II/III secretion system short domain
MQTALLALILVQPAVLPIQGQMFVPLRTRLAEDIAQKLPTHLSDFSDVTVIVDKESNTLILRGRLATLQKARELIHRVDVPTYLCIIPVKRADPAEIAAIVAANLHSSSDFCLVRCTGAYHEVIVAGGTTEELVKARELVRQLDKVKTK